MFVEILQQLCRQTFVFFQQKNISRNSPTLARIIMHLVKMSIGCFLIINSQFVVNFIT